MNISRLPRPAQSPGRPCIPPLQRGGNWAQTDAMICPRKLVMEPEENPKTVWPPKLCSCRPTVVPLPIATRCEWQGPGLEDRLQESLRKKELYGTESGGREHLTRMCDCCDVSTETIHQKGLLSLTQASAEGCSSSSLQFRKLKQQEYVLLWVTPLGIVELG